jgi:Rrf2 family nitric oxide-sensitive transcriptional repressor
MISRSAEYSLRAVLCVAANGDTPLTAHQIAQATRIPAGYLAKLMQTLVKARIILSQRGLNGGFVLARPPQQITLLDVVRVSDGSSRIDACPLGVKDHEKTLCPLHQRLDTVAETAERELSCCTIGDLLAAGADHLRLCTMPSPVPALIPGPP